MKTGIALHLLQICILTILLFSCKSKNQTKPTEPSPVSESKQPAIKPEKALDILYLLKRQNAENIDVDAYHKTFKVNADSLLSYISPGGVLIYDDNEEAENAKRKYSISELKKELMQHRGHAFETFAQLSYIYSQPFPQYSETKIEIVDTSRNSIYIHVGGNYTLTFLWNVKESQYELVKLESFYIEDL